MTASWPQLTLHAGRLSAAELEAALFAAGALAITLQDAADDPVLEPLPDQTPLWAQTRVTGLFDKNTDPQQLHDQLSEHLGRDTLGECEPVTDALADRDWQSVWLKDFKPMRFGKRVWICPSHHQPPEPGAANIVLDPGLAFGTGTHPSTALCLEWLDGADLKDQSVLDYGCGSGILGLAAARLGATSVWGVDIDPQALLASRENASRNSLSEHFTLSLATQLPDEQRFDTVMANILAGPLIELAATLCGHLRDDAQIVLAGLLHPQADAVMSAYHPFCKFDPPVSSDRWIRLSGRRRNTADSLTSRKDPSP